LQLRALGVRRTGTVTANLVRELSMAHRTAASAGVWAQPLELQRRVGVLARPGALACHLSGLATAYRHITLDPALPPDGPVAKWLAGRQRVHLVQLESIEKFADRNPRPSACSGRYALAASRSKTVILNPAVCLW
jgi:hypothetical protein